MIVSLAPMDCAFLLWSQTELISNVQIYTGAYNVRQAYISSFELNYTPKVGLFSFSLE